MKKFISSLAISATLASSAVAGDQQPSQFSFQDISLNEHVSSIQARWLTDCIKGGNNRRSCTAKAVAGAVPLVVDIELMGDHVDAIFVSFPRNQYQMMLDALRSKFGHEDVTTPKTARWFGHRLGSPVPDSLVIRQIPKNAPKPDGIYFFKEVQYGEIEYFSHQEFAAKESEHIERVKETATGL